MDICTTTQFISSLKYPQSRLRTLHNIIYYPDTFLCDKHIATLEGLMDGEEYLFYAPITIKGSSMIRKTLSCARDTHFCDIGVVENEILYSGIGTSSCLLAMESVPQGVRLNEAIYTHSTSSLINGLKAFKSRLKSLDISHNNINHNTIVIDDNNNWHSICNYGLQYGYGGDEESFIALEHNINNLGIPDKPTAKSLEQLRLHSVTTDGDGNIVYPIVEACRRFTSRNGVGFKDRYDNVIIADDFLWATDFSCNRAVVQLKNSKMGVIDRKGRYIIPPLYSSVVYNPTDGISIVHDGELETRFNYLGEQIEEWR